MAVSEVIDMLFASHIVYSNMENLKQGCHAILQAN